MKCKNPECRNTFPPMGSGSRIKIFCCKVADANKFISPEYVKKFADIGRRKIFPNLLLAETLPGPRRLKHLPYALQEKYCTEKVPVLIAGGEALPVDILNLTPAQAAQVIDVGGQSVRSEAAQRAYLEDAATKEVAPALKVNLPYRDHGRKACGYGRRYADT